MEQQKSDENKRDGKIELTTVFLILWSNKCRDILSEMWYYMN